MGSSSARPVFRPFIVNLEYRKGGAARFQLYPYDAEPWDWEYNPSASSTQAFADDEASMQRLEDVQAATQGYNDGWATLAFDVPPGSADLRRDAQAQWDGHPRAHEHFDNSFERYLELAPLYLALGIRNPAEYVATRIVNVTFFGRNTIGHRDLIAPLKRAEDALKARGITPALRSFWSFNARPIRGTSATLSKHAVGRAIDINPDENPRIITRDDVLVIQAVTGVNMAERQQVEVMRQASRNFQHDFTPAWVDQQASQPIVCAIRNRRAELNHYAQHGLLALEQSLIDELKAAGFHWGGHWATSKDFSTSSYPAGKPISLQIAHLLAGQTARGAAALGAADLDDVRSSRGGHMCCPGFSADSVLGFTRPRPPHVAM